jgi:hypothetical protein
MQNSGTMCRENENSRFSSSLPTIESARGAARAMTNVWRRRASASNADVKREGLIPQPGPIMSNPRCIRSWKRGCMMQRIAICLAVVAAILFAGSALARNSRHTNPIPFSHSPCSVFDKRPCTPQFCSVFHHGACIPEIDYPYGENLQLTVQTIPRKEDEAKYQRPDHDLDTIGDLFAALRSCWAPPPADQAREGMQMSVRFSFKKSGELIGPPRMTFATVGASVDARHTYLNAINSSLDGCLPLKFTKGLGGALAGRPIMIRYVDNRDLGKASSENK